MVKRVAIAIAGGSCSGKTTLAHLLTRELDATLFKIDDYYHAWDEFTFEERLQKNYDEPQAIDHRLLVKHVGEMLTGRSVEMPTYDFARFTRRPQPEVVEPKSIIVVEGLFALAWPELSRLCDIRIFVDAPELTCLQRRIARDVEERGRTPESVIERFSGHVVPMYREHVQPTATHANLFADGLESPVQTLNIVSGILDSLHAATLP